MGKPVFRGMLPATLQDMSAQDPVPEKFLSVHLDDGAGSRDKSVGGGTATHAKTIRSCEFDRHAPVLSALFLDLGDRQLPDLGSARDMGAAAGL